MCYNNKVGKMKFARQNLVEKAKSILLKKMMMKTSSMNVCAPSARKTILKTARKSALLADTKRKSKEKRTTKVGWTRQKKMISSLMTKKNFHSMLSKKKKLKKTLKQFAQAPSKRKLKTNKKATVLLHRSDGFVIIYQYINYFFYV